MRGILMGIQTHALFCGYNYTYDDCEYFFFSLKMTTGGGWMIFYFSIIQVHFFFINWISLYFFRIL